MSLCRKLCLFFIIILAGCGNLNATSSPQMPAETPHIAVSADIADNTADGGQTPEPILLSADDEMSEPEIVELSSVLSDETPPELETAAPPTVTFAGDVLLDSSVKRLYAANGFDGIFSDGGLINSSDILMINMEFPFSGRGTPEPDKQFTFRGDPAHISFFTDLGVDIVTLANNHALDYGRDAFLDTVDLLDENDILYVGGGRDYQDACAYRIMEAGGKKIAFLAASRVVPTVNWYAQKGRSGVFGTYDPSALIEKIEEATEKADYVVVYVHWGVEKDNRPQAWQRDMAKRYIEAGASCVIGSHPHVLQGFEYYMGRPIVYSLGNFIFTDAKKDTMTVTVTFDEHISLSAQPYVIRNMKTILADGEDRERILRNLREISFDVDIDEDGGVYPAE